MLFRSSDPSNSAATHIVIDLPEWLGAALVGAILAALGYVAKALIEVWTAHRQRKHARRAALVELYSLLRAAGVTFKIQNEHAKNLTTAIAMRHPEHVLEKDGLDQTLSKGYPHFDADEKELHGLIRSMTINTLRPTNLAILEWLRKDTFHKAQPVHKSKGLSEYLSRLEAHIILWHAKYEAWIPERQDHALVYLDDEKQHGLGFPKGIDKLIADITGFPEPVSPRS